MNEPGVDVAIVGGGLAGAAAAWALTRRGRSVVLLEQFRLGHDRGSSHGSARIFRHAYTDPFYVRLTARARALWNELEADSGRPVLRVTGGVDQGAHVERLDLVLTGAGIEHEVLSARDAGERWPGMAFAGPVVFHPQAGVIDADGAIEAFLDCARGHGARIVGDARVGQVSSDGDGVLLRTEKSTVRARRAILAAGGWIGGLAAIPALQVTQQDVFHFPYAGTPDAWPTFVHLADAMRYGLPGGRDAGPGGGQKIGEHAPGRLTSAENRDGVVDPAVRARTVDYVRRWFPGLVPEPVNETTCLYTWTPDEDFIIDRDGPIVTCSPCSGHGAKFAPLIGELVADLLAGRGAPDRFRLDADRLARFAAASRG